MTPASFLLAFFWLSHVAGQPLPMVERMPPVPPLVELPVGEWKVQFANGVVERCSIGADGGASVTEPLRTSEGATTRHADCIVIRFRDDRTERWTQIGNRVVVEHWCPSSEFPAGMRVVGIGDLLEGDAMDR